MNKILKSIKNHLFRIYIKIFVKRILIFELSGNISNMLLQYSTVHQIAKEHNYKPFFSLEIANKHFPEFSLEIKKIKLGSILPSKQFQILKKKFYKCRENDLCKNSSQNYIYLNDAIDYRNSFDSIMKLIIKEFSLKNRFKSKNIRTLIKEISFENTFVFHFEKLDYYFDNITDKNPFIASLKYYKNAIEYILRINSNPKLIAFSDDPDLVSNYFKEFSSVEKISTEKISHILLLSYSTNLVASASYDSWWAAVLKNNRTGLTIFPNTQDTITKPFNYYYENYPKDWIVL